MLLITSNKFHAHVNTMRYSFQTMLFVNDFLKIRMCFLFKKFDELNIIFLSEIVDQSLDSRLSFYFVHDSFALSNRRRRDFAENPLCASIV